MTRFFCSTWPHAVTTFTLNLPWVCYSLLFHQQSWARLLDADHPQRSCCFVDDVGLPEKCELRLVPAQDIPTSGGSSVQTRYRLRVVEDSSGNSVSAEPNVGGGHSWKGRNARNGTFFFGGGGGGDLEGTNKVASASHLKSMLKGNTVPF